MTALFTPEAQAVEICRSLLQSGIGLLIQSTFLLAAGLLAGRRLAARGPALQALIYRSALVATLLCVLLASLRVGAGRALWSLSLPPTRRAAMGVPLRMSPVEGPVTSRPAVTVIPAPVPLPSRPAAPRESAPPGAPPDSPPRSIEPIYFGAVLMWAGGTCLLLAWLLFCHLWLYELGRRGERIRDGDAAAALRTLCASMRLRPPQLRASGRVRSPFLTGLWRPAIILPADYEAMFDPGSLRAILIHELTHLARRDCAWNLLARIAGAVLWMQPLLWLLLRRLEHASEEICDQAVLRIDVDPRVYADCLLRLAERLVPAPPERAAGVGVVPFRSSLGRRVEQILDRSRRRSLSLAFRPRAVTCLGAAFTMGLGLSLVSAAPTPSTGRAARPNSTGAAEKPPGGPVSGRVVTPDGRPVAGATVWWVSQTEDGCASPAAVKTDAAGRFLFANTAPLRHKNDNPELHVDAPAWGLAFQRVPDGKEAAEITVPPAAELQVRFLDPDGKPVPDLKVVIVFVGGNQTAYFLPPELARRFTSRTDADGVATFAGLPQGSRVRLDVDDDRFARLGHAEMIIYLENGPLTRSPPIHLVPGGIIRGRVVYGPSGKPAAGIKVSAQGMGAGEGWGDGVSDANGEYRLTQIRPGAYNVALGLKDEMARSWTARAHEGVYLQAGEQLTGIDFTLIGGAVIRGRAVAEDTGEPIPGIYLSVYGPAHPQSSGWVQGTVTGPDGSYLHRVPGGRQHLYYGSASPPPGFLMPARTTYDLTVRDGETMTIDFKFPRGGRLKPVRGRVLGPDGKPVAHAEVIATSLGRFGGFGSPLTTDDDGSFVVGERVLAEPAALRARYREMATPAGVTVTGGESVTLRLQPRVLASLSGQVTDRASQPIPDAQIWLLTATFGGGSGTVVTNTNSHGRYAIPSLWPDLSYSIHVGANGFGMADSGHIQLKPGEARELPPLVLKVADRSVAGRVVDQNGDPVVGATVRVDGKDTGFEHATTDASGRFNFAAVCDEKLKLQANFPGYRYAEKDAAPGSADLVLVLRSEKGTEKSDAGAGVKEQFEKLMGQPAPPLRAVAWLNAPPRLPAQLRGRVVLIDFWGIGCGPCVAELPGVQRAANEFRQKGVVVIGLHAAGVSTGELRKFAREHRLTFPLAIDSPDPQRGSFGATFRAFTVEGIPSVAVIDRRGRVAYLGHFLDEAIGHLSSLLAQSSQGGGENAS